MKQQTSNELTAKAQEWQKLAERYANDPEIHQSCIKHIENYTERAKEQKELEDLTPKY
jgi:hypothetical protein